MLVQDAEERPGLKIFQRCRLLVANCGFVFTFAIRVLAPISSREPHTLTVLMQNQPWSGSAPAVWRGGTYHITRGMLHGTPSVVTAVMIVIVAKRFA